MISSQSKSWKWFRKLKKYGFKSASFRKMFVQLLIIGTLLVIFIITFSLSFLRRDNEIHTFPEVRGYYSSKTETDIVPWWWCVGKSNLYDRMTENIMDTILPPFKNHIEDFYAKSCIKAAKSIYSLSPEIVKQIKVIRIETWRDYSTGIHGFVDLEIPIENSFQVVTLEFDDDRALPIKIYQNDFSQTKDSKVWFVVTAHDRSKHFLRFIKSLTNLYDSGEQNFGLCLGTYYSSPREQTFEEQQINNLQGYNFERKIIRAPLPFKKAPILQECIESSTIKQNDIVYMVDVDVAFDANIIQRMKRFVVQGKRAFSPIVWYREKDDHGNTYPDNPHGFAKGGSGIIALYKSDILRFGGYDIKTFQDQHGFEDTDFYHRIKSIKLQMIRSFERTMEHWPHPRDKWEPSSVRDIDTLCPGDS